MMNNKATSLRLLATLMVTFSCGISQATQARPNTNENQKVRVESGLATPVMEAGRMQNAYIRVSLTGYEMPDLAARAPLNVALVLDQSSSMSGDKIQRAKEAAILAVSKLSSNDVVSIITYDSTVNVLVPATRVTDKDRFYTAIESIRAAGSTALFAGTSKGAFEVRKYLDRERVNRVVLLSDGMANIGPDSPSALGQLGKSLAKEGMSVSTIGLGLGYNEDLMTQLANYSDGNHEFVENSADLARVFDKEFGDAMSVVAQNVQIEIICEDGVQPIRIVGRDGSIIGNRVVTSMNQLYSAQQNYVVLEVAVPASKAGQQRQVASVKVTYDNMANQQSETANNSIAATFTRSTQEVKQAIDKVAYESAIEQVANEQAAQAVELRDKGDIIGAQAALKSNAAFLDDAAGLIESPKLEQQSLESLEEVQVVGQQGSWNKNRKLLKEKNYKRSKQQSLRSSSSSQDQSGQE
ncbi:vWA domain-containing protein [Arenicella xantha]|nr:VWA domain-containing protein [Arenicella xantha]